MIKKRKAKTKVLLWMFENGIGVVDLEKHLKLSNGAGSFYVSGNYTSQRIMNFLIDQGCPKDYFKGGRVAVYRRRI